MIRVEFDTPERVFSTVLAETLDAVDAGEDTITIDISGLSPLAAAAAVGAACYSSWKTTVRLIFTAGDEGRISIFVDHGYVSGYETGVM